MTRALTAAELGELDRAAAMGFAREAPELPPELRRPGDDAPALTLVAYAAHQRRLCTLPPRAPPGIQRITAPDDPRPPMPEAARASLRRAVAAIRRQKADELLVPIGWALRERGWRLHPFDTEVVAALRAAAGPYERWLAELAGLDLGDDAATADVDDAHWTTLPPGQRAAWLSRRRFADPDAARALLLAVWPTEKAEVRQRLLPAMVVRLGPADAEFVAMLATDRSAPVRAVGAKLATMVAGELDDAAFTALLASSVKVSRVAMIGPKRIALHAGVDKARLFDAIAGRPLTAVLAALGVELDTVLAGTGEITALFPAFGLSALRDGQRARHEQLARLGADAGWNPNEGTWRERLMTLPREERRACLLPLSEGPLTPFLAAALATPGRWFELLGGPLTARGSRLLRASSGWREILGKVRESGGDAELRPVAAFVPGADARAALADLDAIGPNAAPLVRLTWSLLADLALLADPEGAP